MAYPATTLEKKFRGITVCKTTVMINVERVAVVEYDKVIAS